MQISTKDTENPETNSMCVIMGYGDMTMWGRHVGQRGVEEPVVYVLLVESHSVSKCRLKQSIDLPDTIVNS